MLLIVLVLVKNAFSKICLQSWLIPGKEPYRKSGQFVLIPVLLPCYRQHCAQCKVLVHKLLRGRFWELFAPHGRHIAPMAPKFGTDKGATFQPYRCNGKGIGSPKLTFLLRFDQNVEYKRPAWPYPLRDFHKICRVCSPFQDALAVKISLWICSRGYGVMGVLSWRCLVIPKFSAPFRGETMRQTPKVLEVQERARGPLSPCQVWWGSDFIRRRGGQKRWVFVYLSVCLFVSLFVRQFLNVKKLRPILLWRRWSTETILIPLGRGRFVVVHPCSTLSDCCQLTPLNAEVQNMAKIGGFSPPEDDRIKWSRRNLARKHRPRVCYSTPNLALIGKRGSVQ